MFVFILEINFHDHDQNMESPVYIQQKDNKLSSEIHMATCNDTVKNYLVSINCGLVDNE